MGKRRIDWSGVGSQGVFALCLFLLAGASWGDDACPTDLAPQAVLQGLNALRAQARYCGSRLWPAVPALGWDERLAASSQAFATELAQRDSLTHQGQLAHSLRERLRASGYGARAAGENLAAGSESLEEALEQWLASPAHCENLMLAEFTDVGLTCVSGPGRFRTYWVMHLARSNGR